MQTQRVVQNGIDNLDAFDAVFQGKRLGLISSNAAVNLQLVSSLEVLHKRYGIAVIFAPEHGFYGNVPAGETLGHAVHAATGIPVYSLYQKDQKRLTKERLAQVDAVVYDLPDVGARYYTYLTTMRYAMEDCAAAGKEFILLDRYNPLGDRVEGACLQPGYESFVGAYPICIRYGLTIGELAEMIHTEQKLDGSLTVIPCAGWKRSSLHDQLGRVWVMPSPGIPQFETALLYPGTCLFEATNLSEGRGTTAPFAMIGAPFVEAEAVVSDLRAKRLPGLLCSTAYFTPTFSKFTGELCQGVHLHVTDPHAFRAVETAIELFDVIKRRYPEAVTLLPPLSDESKPMSEQLYGSRAFVEYVDTLEGGSQGQASKQGLLEQMRQEEQAFVERKQAYHRYK